MKTTLLKYCLILSCLSRSASLHAAVHYVNINGSNPAPPYTNWATAATVIQDAIDVAEMGDEVVVTNGVYETGGRAVYPGMTNRVAVTKPLTLRSVNGPDATVIRGYQVPGTTNGDGAVRCVYVTNGAALVGFTLTNGATRSGGWSVADGGGGVFCEPGEPLAVLSNCVLAANSAFRGGGVFRGVLNNCILTGNSADYGGGAFLAVLNNSLISGNSAAWNGGGVAGGAIINCTVTGNSAVYGGGAAIGLPTDSFPPDLPPTIIHNCILYYNTATFGGANYDYGSAINFSCTTPVPAEGSGNFSTEPQLASMSHLSAGSPCRNVGSIVFPSNVDIDGEPWANPPSIGCDEFSAAGSGPVALNARASFTNVATGFEVQFAALISGNVSASRWEFGDGAILSNRPYATHTWQSAGDYEVVLRAYNGAHPNGLSATVTVHVVSQPVHYVAVASANPVAPYTSWTTAASNIQDAVDSAFAGGTVLVSNGVYQTGGRAVHGILMNRVAVTKPLTMRSVNGPEATVIHGHQVAGTRIGDGAVRCFYLASGAVLVGFTLTNGATRAWWPPYGDFYQLNGGAVYCESVTAVLSNCVLRGNSAEGGGGALSGTLNSCTLVDNWANEEGGGARGSMFGSILNNCILKDNSSGGYGGGADQCTLSDCTLSGNSAYSGGGAGLSTLNNCTLLTNSATGSDSGFGGGAEQSTLNNCKLIGNTATVQGGGAFGATVNNCLLIGNSAPYEGGGQGAFYNCTIVSNSASIEGGGTIYGTLNNCLVYYNTAPRGPNYSSNALVDYSCTTPLPTKGVGNITNAPLFVDAAGGNFHLQSNSPCINAGRNADAPPIPDLDGNPRIRGGTVDIGAYEFQSPRSVISYAWLQKYGLSTDGSADFTDLDGDGPNNWQEWRAWTDPTNSGSVLRLLTPLASTNGMVVHWQSVSGQRYFLERSTSLTAQPAFVALASNIVGQAETTIFADTNAVSTGPFFYRVGVNE